MASSRRNFALRLANLLYSEEERRVLNCSGSKGKERLDETKLTYIQGEVMKFWPPDSRGTQDEAWRECIKAIDEGGRALVKKLKNSALTDRANTTYM